MSRRARILPILAASMLSGCVSVFPQAKPVQLYELTPEVPPAPTGAAGPSAVNVRLSTVGFEHAAAGDRILTVREGQAAYIAGARWLAPAQTLFDESLTRAFAQHGAGVRLISHGGAAASSLALDVEVESFRVNLEDHGATVETAIRARMIRFPDRTVVLDRRFDVTRKAEADRVGDIVKAYNAALGEALSSLVDATEQAAHAS